MKIVMADIGIPFDGERFRAGPLGGAETAFVELAEAFAARGHDVSAYASTDRASRTAGVSWRPVSDGLPEDADLYVANRSWKLLSGVAKARKRLFWIHNPAGYLLKLRYLARMLYFRPTVVFSGGYHASTLPIWAPTGGRAVIPYGISDLFRTAAPAGSPPPPRALFVSNPLRGLDWLLDVWERLILPKAPGAELHLYAGPAVYAGGGKHGAAMKAVLSRAQRAPGVLLQTPVGKADLAGVYASARVMLYGGDVGETFCLAVGEAQAVGLPCVLRPIGSLPERIIPDRTGFLAADDAAFADHAIQLLRDDALWSAQQSASLASQRARSWEQVAVEFEALAA
jgi:glycosyltransferase involved in cell wall biosynthesis